MGEQKTSNELIELLALPEYIALACEIYKAFPGDGERKQFQNGRLLELLNQPENRRVVATVRQSFPDAVRLLGNQRLLEMIYQQCRTKLRSTRHWEAQITADERWPSIQLVPSPANLRYWCFCLDMHTPRKIPFTLKHGVAYSDEEAEGPTGGRPRAMSQRLQKAVKELEAEFAKAGFNVKPQHNDWFVRNQSYNWCAVDYDPQLLRRISNGALAAEIADEFLQFFRMWSGKIKRLNSLLS